VLALAGCSSIPAGGEAARDPVILAMAADGGRPLGRLGVAPVMTLTLADDEATKGWRLSEVARADPSALRAHLARGLAALGRFERVRSTSSDVLADAWAQRDDLVVRAALRDLRSHSDGRNGWWIPNIVNWFFWVAPAWWVATEEYSLSATLELVISSAETGRVITTREVPLRVRGTFDEFDRGWQFFGFLHASLDAGVWRTIVTALTPELERQAAVSGAIECVRALEAVAAAGELERARTKTLVLSIGAGRFNEPDREPLADSAGGALALASAARALVDRDQHVLTLTDAGATLAAVRSAVSEHLGRARAGDQVLVYFNGVGARRGDEAPALVLYDDVLGLDELARLLGALEGTKLVLLDAGLGEGPAGRAPAPALATWTRPGLALIAAGGLDDPALAAAHLGGRVFTYYLLRALRTAGSGETGADLFARVRPRVIAEAALLGERQTPRAAGELDAFVLRGPGSARPGAP
jgi:hypothetical protein